MRRCVFFLLILVITFPVSAQDDVTDDQVREAVAGLQAYFWRIQDTDTGAWPHRQLDSGDQRGGATALVVTALIASGVSPQHPQLDKAIDYLEDLHMTGTYAVAQRAHVWSQLSRDYHRHLVADGLWLLRAADRTGQYGYTAGAAGGINLSTTHYGVLGLWEAAKNGVRQPAHFWSTVGKSIMNIQNRDGGWGYTPLEASRGSMTAAGLTVLLIVKQQVHRSDMRPEPDLETAIKRGLAWIDTRFINHENINGSHVFYYLYAIERVALACGAKRFNGRDWFQIGAQFILAQQREDGQVARNFIDSAFALLFLSHGSVPIWITKVELPQGNWNHRPDDIFFLNRHLSDLSERELNWQTLSINEPVGAWVDTPVAYLATDRAMELTDEQEQTLRDYLDLGGTLIVNPDQGSASPGRVIRKFAEKHYPQWPMRELRHDHAIYNALQDVEGIGGQKVFAVSNGVRELIVLSGRDWGFVWQSKDELADHPAGKVAANLWAILTDRGLLRARLGGRFEPRREPVRHTFDEPDADKPRRVITVARARYDGNWLPEPRAWSVFADAFYNRAPFDLNVIDVDLDQIGQTDAKLVHLCGVDPIDLTVEQLNAIGRYTNRGGTVFVETAGGLSRFARSIEEQVMTRFHVPAARIGRSHSIVNGAGLQGGSDCSEVRFRRFAVLTMSLGFQPRLAAMPIEGVPAIVFSHEDFSQGMLRVNHWGIAGYDVSSAERLLTNLILWAGARPLKGASP